jgi:hypothetical protein
VRQSSACKDVSTQIEDIVGFRYQATASEDLKDGLGMCRSEKYSARISDRVITTCGYNL